MKDMKSRKINIALIGCGRISQKHILAIISENKRCELVAICDNNEKQIEKISDFYDSQLKKSNLQLKHLIKLLDKKEFLDYDDTIVSEDSNNISESESIFYDG